MARLKKAHKEALQSRDVKGFLKGLGGLQKDFDLADFRIHIRFEPREADATGCLPPNKLTWCDSGNGKLVQVCLAPGEACPPVNNGILG